MKKAMIGLAAGALLLTACSSGSAKAGDTGSGQPTASASASELNDHTDPTYSGVGLTPPQPRPQFTLTDQAGKTYKFGSETAGKPTLLYFGYTHCPDVCPTTLADIAQALQAVPAAVRDKTQVVFVTTDVKRDTPAVLKSYLSQFDAGLPNPFIGLTGSQTQIDAAQVAAHVALAEDDGQTHAAQVLLYGPDDYARVSFLQSTDETAQITHDLPKIAGGK
ncbi:MAG TPA: SCO family protein [Jatrophihabitans sp.]|nr:SCO family protein [Jatrophihabitans sp.]